LGQNRHPEQPRQHQALVDRRQSEEFFLEHESECFQLFQLVKIFKAVLIFCFLPLI
jgi:hypothetical protein